MSIPREGSRDIGDGIIVSMTPDVCKTPVGSSMVPVPYSITAKQADDANTVATVRMTKKRAHNMASIVTKSTGDAPGTGTGIKSGTVGSVCHPKTHSGTVRIRGEYAIRNDDVWEMNNRNTVGKLAYVRSVETFDPTLPFQFQQTLVPGAEPVAGPALMTGEIPQITLAEEVITPDPVADPGTVFGPGDAPPGWEPPVPQGQPDPPRGNNSNNGSRFWQYLRALGRGGGPSGPGAMNAMAILEDWLERNVPRPDEWFRAPRQPGPTISEEWWRPLPADTPDEQLMIPRIADHEIDYSRSAERIRDHPPFTGATEDQTRITEEERDEPPCTVDTYNRLQGQCPGGDDQRHHIVPDFAFRYGSGRRTTERVPDMPSLGRGMAICLDGHAATPGTEHNIAQTTADNRITALADHPDNPIPGTVPLGYAVDSGLMGIAAARPECLDAAITAMEEQHAGHDFRRRVSGVKGANTGEARRILAEDL